MSGGWWGEVTSRNLSYETTSLYTRVVPFIIMYSIHIFWRSPGRSGALRPLCTSIAHGVLSNTFVQIHPVLLNTGALHLHFVQRIITFKSCIFQCPSSLYSWDLSARQTRTLAHHVQTDTYRASPHLTDGVRSTLRGSARTGCGKPDRQVVGASSADYPSCSPLRRPDCTRRWDLRAEKTLNISGVRRCPRTTPVIEQAHWGFDTNMDLGISTLKSNYVYNNTMPLDLNFVCFDVLNFLGYSKISLRWFWRFTRSSRNFRLP